MKGPTRFLVFRLYGAMASWGEAAPGDVRPTELRPTRSALLGLLAAAVGLDRRDEEAHRALASELTFGLLVESAGVPIVDFHTAQLRKPSKRWRPRTRTEQLDEARDKLMTVPSRRDYRCDALVEVAVTSELASPRYSLEALCAALERPAFTLYLGRKACPPALPLAPRILDAATLREAFESYQSKGAPGEETLGITRALGSTTPGAAGLFWETASDIEPGARPEQKFERRDDPLSRKRRTFRARWESYAPWPSRDAEEGSHAH